VPAQSQGKLVVVSGPSGAGKTSVMRRVYQQCRVPLVRSVSATTRPPRPDETDGVDYHFLTDAEFTARRQRGEFIECCQVFNQNEWYGTLRTEVASGLNAGKWVVLEIDVHGAAEIVRQFPDTITIFLLPASREELERRLRGRNTETDQQLQRRLAHAERELAEAKHYKYQVVNDQLDRTVREICAIITEEWEHSRDD
jgi:guanylate kinase